MQVLANAEYWVRDGLPPDAVLALVQNAIPLTVGGGPASDLQARSHARVLAALLLLMDGWEAAVLATELVEMLGERSSTYQGP